MSGRMISSRLMRMIVMRIMGLLFLRSRFTDDTLVGAQITLFQVIGDDM